MSPPRDLYSSEVEAISLHFVLFALIVEEAVGWPSSLIIVVRLFPHKDEEIKTVPISIAIHNIMLSAICIPGRTSKYPANTDNSAAYVSQVMTTGFLRWYEAISK